MPPVLRLYVLGSLDKEKPERSLTIFAEYKSLRGLSHVVLKAAELGEVVSAIDDLRGYVEGGFPAVDNKELADLGSRLFGILIVDQTKALFLIATGECRATERFLPLEIVAEDFEIAGWPWEYLYNSPEKKFIAQDFHPVSRSIFSMSSRPALPPKKGNVRILMILGVLPDDPDTTPAEEIKCISEVFETQLGVNKFHLEILPASEYRKIQERISNGRFDVIHYFGHAGFDYGRGEGFLSIARRGAKPSKIWAINLANILMGSGVRLVFLNACKTAQGSPTDSPGRSSVAATLLNAGIPAVIGTQFSLPDVSAHALSSTIYNALAIGLPIGEAVRGGRNAMPLAENSDFFDWGIPVLYSTDPGQIVFPSKGNGPKWTPSFKKAITSDKLSLARLFGSGTIAGAPSVVVERTRAPSNDKRVKVALLDIDSKVGSLADLARLVNTAQEYYNFEVVYLPVPSGYVRIDLDDDPQTFVPRLEGFLEPLPDQLQVEFVCCLTQNLIAFVEGNAIRYNYFACSLTNNDKVSVVSTFDLRRYAKESKVPFAKAVFRLCLSMLVSSDPRWGIDFHAQTVGCLFDFCENRDDFVVGLKKNNFDHKECRDKIRDDSQLAAVDSFFALKFSES